MELYANLTLSFVYCKFTAFDLNLYGIKNREKKVFTSRNVNINEAAFISLKSL